MIHKADHTDAITEASARVRQLQTQLNDARAAYRLAVADSYAATGEFKVGDIVLYQGKKATISSVRPSGYNDAYVRVFVRKHRKTGEPGTQEFETYGNMTKVTD